MVHGRVQFRLKPTVKTLFWFDTCECGDFRYQHEKGNGECKFIHHAASTEVCRRFRRTAIANNLPSFYTHILGYMA